jgi:hypothetical protein
MRTAANAMPQFVQKLVRQAKADPKKASVLGVLVLVMLVLWLRMMAGGGSGPSRASANITGGSRSDGGGGALTSDNYRRPGGGRSTPTLKALMEWAQRPIAPLSRNPFVINYDYYPQDGTRPALPRAPQGDGFWDQLAKSMTARADSIKEHQMLVENLRLQAAQLKVQSTVMGAKPRALINGEFVGEGSIVASFRVSKIEGRRIVLEREGIKLEVRFN